MSVFVFTSYIKFSSTDSPTEPSKLQRLGWLTVFTDISNKYIWMKYASFKWNPLLIACLRASNLDFLIALILLAIRWCKSTSSVPQISLMVKNGICFLKRSWENSQGTLGRVRYLIGVPSGHSWPLLHLSPTICPPSPGCEQYSPQKRGLSYAVLFWDVGSFCVGPFVWRFFVFTVDRLAQKLLHLHIMPNFSNPI